MHFNIMNSEFNSELNTDCVLNSEFYFEMNSGIIDSDYSESEPSDDANISDDDAEDAGAGTLVISQSSL